MLPAIETVGVYGEVFGIIAVTAGVSAVIVLALSPFLTKWMHEGVEDPEAAAAGQGAGSGHPDEGAVGRSFGAPISWHQWCRGFRRTSVDSG